MLEPFTVDSMTSFMHTAFFFFWRCLDRYSKFQGVGNLSLHFPDNFGGDTSQIHYIGLKGEATQVWWLQTNQGFIKLHWQKNAAYSVSSFINTVPKHYISRWRGTLLPQLFMNWCQIHLTTSKFHFPFVLHVDGMRKYWLSCTYYFMNLELWIPAMSYYNLP